MDKITLIAALAALAVGAFSISQKDGGEAKIADLTEANSDLKDHVTALEVKIDKLLSMDGTPSTLSADAPASGGEGSDAGSVGLATRKPTTPLERLAELERTVKRQNEMLAKMDAEEKATGDAASSIRRFMPGNFYFNADAAARDLELSERQKTDMEDTLDRAKRELKDLYATENDDGETWAEVGKPKMTKMGNDSGISFAMPNFQKINKFKQSRIPGSSETFGQAEKRIKDNAYANVRRTLPADKAKKWDKANKDALLRDRGSSVSVSSIHIDTSDK